jgi:hypothetical protein
VQSDGVNRIRQVGKKRVNHRAIVEDKNFGMVNPVIIAMHHGVGQSKNYLFKIIPSCVVAGRESVE